MSKIYLDYAAATPMDKQVVAAMQPYFADKFYNPSSDYGPSREVKNDLSEARKTIASLIGAKPAEIIFTAGGTEANNLAISGVATSSIQGELVATDIEHESVLKPLEYIGKWGRKITLVKPEKDGVIKPEKILKAITGKTTLVSVIYANNEIGTIQPIKKIAEGIEQIRRERKAAGNELSLYLHTDACQATNYLDMHAKRLGVDLMSINAGKIYGPKQCGALFVRTGVRLNPLIFGGGQELGLRSGTENIPSIIGFGEAMKITDKIKKDEALRVQKLRDFFWNELIKKIPNMQLNGSLKHRLPNNLNILFPGIDNETLLIQLDELGIMASAGSACSASSAGPSHVLSSIGLSDSEAQSSIRFTLGRNTTKSETIKTVTILNKLSK